MTELGCEPKADNQRLTRCGDIKGMLLDVYFTTQESLFGILFGKM